MIPSWSYSIIMGPIMKNGHIVAVQFGVKQTMRSTWGYNAFSATLTCETPNKQTDVIA